MGIFTKLSTLIKSNINDLISRAENPEKMLNQIIVDMRDQLAKGRGKVPVLRLIHRDAKDIRIDGKLEDKFWRNLSAHPLKELQTGREPALQTRFKAAWAGDSLYFGIQCLELEGARPKIAAMFMP